jgi:hypothetical protein
MAFRVDRHTKEGAEVGFGESESAWRAFSFATGR